MLALQTLLRGYNRLIQGHGFRRNDTIEGIFTQRIITTGHGIDMDGKRVGHRRFGTANVWNGLVTALDTFATGMLRGGLMTTHGNTHVTILGGIWGKLGWSLSS